MKNTSSKIIKVGVKKFLYKYFNLYRGKYLGIHLQGGLCNKLLVLTSACDIALKENCRLIEPYFGWKEKILFSEIYDLEYFNDKMHELTGIKDLIISRSDHSIADLKKKSLENVVSLWNYSEEQLTRQREQCSISRNDIKLKVLKSLRLKGDFEEIVNKQALLKPYTAIQIRTESDWKKYTRDFNGKGKERIFVPAEEIIEMLKKFDTVGNIFFTSGENHEVIQGLVKEAGWNASYFYKKELEYEQNAAINFEVCSRADRFIGLSRSSYSNLISLKRATILNTYHSYIYNYGDQILRRKDMGLQYEAEVSVSKKTSII